MTEGPPICPLYGVVIRDAMNTGDKQLMSSVLRVSQHMLSSNKAIYGNDPCVDDWAAAQAELEKAMG